MSPKKVHVVLNVLFIEMFKTNSNSFMVSYPCEQFTKVNMNEL